MGGKQTNALSDILQKKWGQIYFSLPSLKTLLAINQIIRGRVKIKLWLINIQFYSDPNL